MAKRACEAPGRRTHESRAGQTIVEVSLVIPWIFFLFLGIFDFGFYAYAAICTQNAARAVALSAAQPIPTDTPCNVALGELRGLPNVTGASCNALPVIVSVTPLSTTATTLANGASVRCADCDQNASSTSSLASVTYQTVPLFPIPGVLTGQLTLTRVAEVRNITQ
jgi:hypothetical protein